MFYYMELDKDKAILEIKEVKNVHNLAKELKMSWGTVNSYVNCYIPASTRLNCGVRYPLLKMKGKKMWLIYDNIEVAKYYNYRNMSRNVWDELSVKSEYINIWTYLDEWKDCKESEGLDE